MMSDPERLLDETAGDPAAELERDLLRSIADVSPPAFARRAAWEGIAARLGAATALAAGANAVARSSVSAPSAAGTATVLKGTTGSVATGFAQATASKVLLATVLGVGATVAVGAAWLGSAHRSNIAATSAVAHPASPPRELAQDTEHEGTALPKEATAASTDERPGKSPQRLRLDQALAMESAALTEARAALRRGDPRSALSVLHRLDVRSPRGVLRQEREVLAIEALSALGEKAAARKRAATFVSSFPNSPHTPLLRHLADTP